MRVAELCISAADSAEVRAIVGATCIGVWKQTGEHTYVLHPPCAQTSGGILCAVTASTA
jgi:hypothetical protein